MSLEDTMRQDAAIEQPSEAADAETLQAEEPIADGADDSAIADGADDSAEDTQGQNDEGAGDTQEAEAEDEVDAEPDPDADAEPDPDADAVPDPDADVETDAADAVADPDADTEPDPDADAEPDPDADVEPEATDTEPARGKLSTGVWVGIAAVALIAGLFVGANVIGGNGPSPIAASSVAESELDSPIATYTYNGNRHDLTIRDSIAMSTSLDAAKDSEGNYAVPSVDNIVNLARNNVLMEEAVKRNVTVSDEEIATFAEQSVGSSDYAELAKQYGLEEASVKDMLKNSCTLSKLQTTVVEQEAGKAPEAPEAPKDVEKDGDKTSAKYAKYIISLVGTEWDAEKGTWASEKSMYAQILKDYKIKADSASYNAAKEAYDTASQVYSTTANAAWNSYIDGLFSNTSIQIRTIAP